MTAAATKPVVLVVDDEPRIVDSICDLLEEAFAVLTSTDSTQALGLLHDAEVAVILADQRMPGLTGDQFLAKAQELSDATRILVTGYADIDALIRAVNYGQIHTYLAKPWDPAQLKRAVLKAANRFLEVCQLKAATATVAMQQEALARSEGAFRNQTKILQSILDSMGDGVIVADEKAEILVFNPAAERIIGTDAPQTPQAQWSHHFGIYRPDTTTLYPPDELPLARALRGESLDALELYINNPEKANGMFVSVNVRPLKDNGGGVVVLRDMTARKHTEQLLRRTTKDAERANQAKSEFLSRMSHELRTPLNSILGFAQLLEMNPLPDEQQDYVDHIIKGGQHLLGLINEVLDVARIEAGHLSISLQAVPFEEVIQEALDLIRPIAAQRKITIRRRVAEDGKRYVNADPQRLKQVLLNLLSNAVKYNVEHGQIDIGYEGCANGFLRLSVADTGPGITEQDRERLFRPFERLHAERLCIEGTGLGLALCRGLIEAMGGRIGAESTIGQGSTFWLELAATDPN